MLEVALVALTVATLYGAIYVVASRAMQLFSLVDRATHGKRKPVGLRGRFLDVLTKDPREVLLAAEYFKSLAYLIIAGLVIWAVPRWCAKLQLPWPPFLIVALLMTWFVRGLTGEVLPKAAPPEETEDDPQLHLAGLALIWWLLRPAIVISRWFEKRHPAADRTADREDIVEHAIDTLAESAGMNEPVIEPDERKMIQGIIGMEDTEVREVMVPRVNIVAVEAHATVEDVRRLTAKSGHSRLPVYEDDLDSILGILYVKDLFCAEQTGGTTDLAALARRAFVVPETKKVDALLEEFKRQKKHIAIVVDEFGGTAGLVTLEDILEEIVGEIEDEHDRNGSAIEWISDGIMRAQGVVSLEEVADAFGIDLPGDEFETIGGLIYDRVGGIPRAGQSFTDYGLAFTVERVDGQRISRIRVEKQR
ncbi:MAG TPA: hemolysin family protein [Acidobacteriota bacterium]|nr:hemolysin family protein [Acidobacteriota bacterium]